MFIEQKFHSNAFVGQQIKIKTEANIAKHLGIKRERETTKPTPKDSDKEKKLIDAMVVLKSENQKLTFDLKKKQEECKKMASEKLELEKSASATAVKLTHAENKLSRLKAEHADETSEYNRKLSDLRSQNQTLSARIKQLQNAMVENQPQKCEQENSDDDVHEVECVVGDKKIGKVQHYRIRWKGYGPEDDTWERESNLQCPSILNDYLKSKNGK